MDQPDQATLRPGLSLDSQLRMHTTERADPVRIGPLWRTFDPRHVTDDSVLRRYQNGIGSELPKQSSPVNATMNTISTGDLLKRGQTAVP